jgi:exosome complex RNA-binding protein Rrp42 (RNase PH superfamily)
MSTWNRTGSNRTTTKLRHTTGLPLRRLQLRRFPVPLTIGLYEGKFLCDLTLAEEERVQSRLTVLVDSNTGQVRECVPE